MSYDLWNNITDSNPVVSYKYIYVLQGEVSKSGKTATYLVMNKSGDYLLSEIKWYPAWRQYCFFPQSDTVWNNSCLQDILNFIHKLKTGQIKILEA